MNFLDNYYFSSHCFSNCTWSLLSPTAGAAKVSAISGASELPPEQVWEMPHSSCGPHSHLPVGVLPEKQRVVKIVPSLCPPSLRGRVDSPQAFPQRREPQTLQAGPVVGGLRLSPDCSFSANERTKSHVLSLLDTDIEDQNKDSTVPLCGMKSRTSRPSIYDLEKGFLS